MVKQLNDTKHIPIQVFTDIHARKQCCHSQYQLRRTTPKYITSFEMLLLW